MARATAGHPCFQQTAGIAGRRPGATLAETISLVHEQVLNTQRRRVQRFLRSTWRCPGCAQGPWAAASFRSSAHGRDTGDLHVFGMLAVCFGRGRPLLNEASVRSRHMAGLHLPGRSPATSFPQGGGLISPQTAAYSRTRPCSAALRPPRQREISRPAGTRGPVAATG